MDNEEITIDNNIIKIEIIEKVGKAYFYTKNGVRYEASLEKILHNKRSIYNDFNISKKCKELTTSFFQRKKLERRLNPVIIEALNDNNEIYKYINCIKNSIQLPFLLEHDRRESSLSSFDKRMMKIVSEYEERLGATVKQDDDLFEEIRAEKEREKNEKFEIEKKYDDALFLLTNAEKNNIYCGSEELDKIEKNIEQCAKWYISAGDYYEASSCIDTLKNLINDERKKYYEPFAEKELKKGNVENCKQLMRLYLLKICRLDKLIINNEYINGDKVYAKELYINLLNRLGINLNNEELRKSISKAIATGTYYKEDMLTGELKSIKIVGDEQLQRIIDKAKEKTDVINKKSGINENSEIKKLSKDEINEMISKSMKMTDIIKYQKGAIIPVINNIINYLKEHDDKNVKKFLNEILKDLEDVSAIDLLRQNIGMERKYNTLIFDYISSIYKDGIIGKNGEIIQKNNNKHYYYEYLLNRRLNEGIDGKVLINRQRLQEIKEYYTENSENIERGYLEILKMQDSEKKTSLYEKLKASQNYSKAIQDLNMSTKNNYIKLLAIKEDLKNGVYRHIMGRYTNKKEFDGHFNTLIERFNAGEQFNKKVLEDLGDISYEGVTDVFGNIIIEPRIDIAKQIYSQIEKENQLNNKKYSRLFNIHKAELNPITDKRSIKRINKIMKEKGITKELEDDISRGRAEYVCSDLHGQYEIYKDIIDRIGDNDKLYILGDVIDRGPDGIKILQDIVKRQERGQVELFVGNHEYMMLQALFFRNKQVEKVWMSESNGGKETKEEFNKISVEEKNRIMELLLNSLVYKEIISNNERIHLVHAKAIPGLNKEEERVKNFIDTGRIEDLEMAVWTRKGDRKSNRSNEVWKDEEIGKDNMFTIIGHTPTNGTIDISKGYVNIDCGASYFGNECLLRINDGKVVYFDNFERCNQQMKDNHREYR